MKEKYRIAELAELCSVSKSTMMRYIKAHGIIPNEIVSGRNTYYYDAVTASRIKADILGETEDPEKEIQTAAQTQNELTLYYSAMTETMQQLIAVQERNAAAQEQAQKELAELRQSFGEYQKAFAELTESVSDIAAELNRITSASDTASKKVTQSRLQAVTEPLNNILNKYNPLKNGYKKRK